MSNPAVTNVFPTPNMTDVVLGESIVVTFSEPIDLDSFNNSTFALTGPNLSSIVTPDQLVEKNPTPSQGRGYILGTFGFSTKTFVNWAAFTSYHIGDQVLDSNGNVQTASESGMSAPYAPAWQMNIGDATVDNNIPTWQANFTYSFGQYILDPHGMVQKVTVGGLSGLVIPQFNQTLSGTTPGDGAITWTNYGPLNSPTWVNGGPANSGVTIATFIPAKPLLPGTTYTVLVVGSDSVLADSFVKNVSGNPMLHSYQWSFITGTLNILVPPIQNPIRPMQTFIKPDQIKVIPRPTVGGEPLIGNPPSIQIIDIIFPAPIDTNSFDPSDILIGLEPILNDPDVMTPPNVGATYVVQGNKLIVKLTGPIVASMLHSGGSGYAVNDTGTINGGNNAASYRIDSVDGGGAVLAYRVITGGLGYFINMNSATADNGSQPGVGTGFTVDITSVL